MLPYGMMNDTELYSNILGIVDPWKVVNVKINIDDETIFVFLNFDGPSANFYCPICNELSNFYDRNEVRQWRHLDSCQFQTYIVASIPRVQCRKHGVKTVNVFWAEPMSRFTRMFEEFAISMLRATQVQARAAKMLRLSPGQIHDIMERAVERGMQRRDTNANIEHLSVDEKSFQRGHNYITVLSDPVDKRVLDISEGRKQEDVEGLMKTSITSQQRDHVRSVSMDMWTAFMNASKKVFPNADTVHDRFHISSYLNKAVDMTRRSEHRRLTSQKDDRLNKTKYLWLRSDATLTEKQRTALAALINLELETAKVWAFKESFRQFFDCTTELEGLTFFNYWYEAVLVLENRYLTPVAEMLKSHLAGLLAYIRHGVTNAAAEGLNAQIQQIKSNAKGFGKWNSFRVAILFHLGKLDMSPHKTP